MHVTHAPHKQMQQTNNAVEVARKRDNIYIWAEKPTSNATCHNDYDGTENDDNHYDDDHKDHDADAEIFCRLVNL